MNLLSITNTEIISYGFYVNSTAFLSTSEKKEVLDGIEKEEKETARNRKATAEEIKTGVFRQPDIEEARGIMKPDSEGGRIRVITDPKERTAIYNNANGQIPITIFDRKFKSDSGKKSRCCVNEKNVTEERAATDTHCKNLTMEVLRLMIIIAISLSLFLRIFDVTQAFLRGESFGPGDPKVFVKAPKCIYPDKPWDDTAIWQLLRPLYGIIDSPMRWMRTLDNEFLKRGFKKHPYDRAMWYLSDGESGTITGMAGSHVDDIIWFGFLLMAQTMKSICDKFQVENFFEGEYLDFTGKRLRQTPSFSSLDLTTYINDIVIPSIAKTAPELYDQFKILIGILIWVIPCRPAIAAVVNLAAATSMDEISSNVIKKLIAVIKFLKHTACWAMRFVKLNLSCMCLVLSSFANGARKRTQGGAVLYLCNRDQVEFLSKRKVSKVHKRDEAVGVIGITGNLLWFSSKKLRRVANSTLAAETISLVTALDRAISLRMLIERLLSVVCPIYVFTDCASLVDNCRALCPNISSKRTEIDLELLRECLDEGLVESLNHTPSKFNYADELTKESPLENSRIEISCTTNIIEIPLDAE